MRLSDLLGMSLGSLFKRKARTILTVLGVIIGTVSIVVMVSLGIGMKNSMLESVSQYGSLTTVEVQQPNRYSNDGKERSDKEMEKLFLTDALADEIRSYPHVVEVYPALRIPVILTSGQYYAYAELEGRDINSLKASGMKLGEGDFPKEGDPLSLIYGNMILTEFSNIKTGYMPYWDTGQLPDIDLMNGGVFTVFDVDGYFRMQGGGVDENGTVMKAPKKYVIPSAGIVEGGPEDYNAFAWQIYCDLEPLKAELKRVFRGKPIPEQPLKKGDKPYKEIFYSTLYVETDSMEAVAEVQQMLQSQGYQTYSEAEWIEQDMQVMNIIQAVLGGIGAVALFVAAIGITNTMMMSIYERTKEIGIMKVIGCRIRDIQALFLIEAGYIGFIGGTVGVIISYILSAILNKVVAGSSLGADMGLGTAGISQIPLWLGGVAVIFAVLIAMIAGFIPSLRAMKLSPLAAIRAE
ncbi:MAG: ABC transporter permease [Lachnospiraceae bacterium]|nr:ABC transporter permease [Lachnospiraceae bacterium]